MIIKKILKHSGQKNSSTPIMLELIVINKYLKKFKNVKILIDDIRLFQTKYHNYPKIDIIVNWCRKNNLTWSIEQDIFIAENN